MNGKQKIALLVGILALALAGLFPPWYSTVHRTELERERARERYPGVKTINNQEGHRYLFRPPQTEIMDWYYGRPVATKEYRLDTSRLYVIWLMIAGVTAGIVLFLKDAPAQKANK